MLIQARISKDLDNYLLGDATTKRKIKGKTRKDSNESFDKSDNIEESVSNSVDLVNKRFDEVKRRRQSFKIKGIK